jgi:hypothetical protein
MARLVSGEKLTQSHGGTGGKAIVSSVPLCLCVSHLLGHCVNAFNQQVVKWTLGRAGCHFGNPVCSFASVAARVPRSPRNYVQPKCQPHKVLEQDRHIQ